MKLKIPRLRKFTIKLFLILLIVLIGGMNLHKEVFFYIQKTLGMNNKFEIGCAYIYIDPERFVVKLIGGENAGIKYYGFVPIDIIVNSENYVVLKNIRGDGEIYFHSIGGEELTKYFKLKSLLNTDTKKFKDYSLMLIENKYPTVRSLSQKENGIEIYVIPSVNLSISLKDILYDKNLFKIENSNNMNCQIKKNRLH